MIENKEIDLFEATNKHLTRGGSFPCKNVALGARFYIVEESGKKSLCIKPAMDARLIFLDDAAALALAESLGGRLESWLRTYYPELFKLAKPREVVYVATPPPAPKPHETDSSLTPFSPFVEPDVIGEHKFDGQNRFRIRRKNGRLIYEKHVQIDKNDYWKKMSGKTELTKLVKSFPHRRAEFWLNGIFERLEMDAQTESENARTAARLKKQGKA